MRSAHDDDEPLVPHAGVHAPAEEINDVNISPAPSEPEQLRRKHVAEQHADPPVPPEGPEYSVIKGKPFVMIAAVPSHEKFHGIGVSDERSGQQDDLRHLV